MAPLQKNLVTIGARTSIANPIVVVSSTEKNPKTLSRGTHHSGSLGDGSGGFTATVLRSLAR